MTVLSRIATKTYSNRAICRDGPFGRRYYTVIYAIDAPGSDRLKFGRTLDVNKRFRSLCSASPIPLVLLGYLWLPDDAEAEIHSFLRDEHSHGEWFVATGRSRTVAALIAAKKLRELWTFVGFSQLQGTPEHFFIPGPPS